MYHLDLHAFGCRIVALHTHHMDIHVVSMSINTCIYTTHCAYAGSKQFNVEMGDVLDQVNGHANGHANGNKASSTQNGLHTIV